MNKAETSNIQRYVCFPLPPYRYIPGQNLHPLKVSEQTHIPELPESNIEFSDKSWKSSERYLYAIDLFNYGYYWEVHEVLEKLWLCLGKKSPTGIFIQGLIQLSVAVLKKTQSNSPGFSRLAEKALPKLLSQSGVFLGIDVDSFVKQFKSFIGNERVVPPLILLNMV